MKALYLNLKLIFSGDTVLLLFGILAFLASLANRTQWQMLRGFRYCGICTMLFSLTFCLVSGIEFLKNKDQKRTMVAAAFFLAATIICLSAVHITIER